MVRAFWQYGYRALSNICVKLLRIEARRSGDIVKPV